MTSMSIHNTETNIDTLIIVCCHAIYVGANNAQSANNIHRSSPPPSQKQEPNVEVRNEFNWLIEPFQQGEVSTFIDHVRIGVEHLATHPNAILCFSGGATKPAKTGKTEAQGYRDVAEHMEWFGRSAVDNDGNSTRAIDNGNSERADVVESQLADRVFNEEWATDSYQNVLLSLIQYPIWVEAYEERISRRSEQQGVQQTGKNDGSYKSRLRIPHRLPQRLIIVTHAFKHERFADLHIPAIRSLWKSLQGKGTNWNIAEFDTIGSNPPFDPARMREIEEGDRKRGYGAWRTDLHGNGELLSQKRRTRGWDKDKFLGIMNMWFGEHDMEMIRRLVEGTNSIVL